MAKKETEVVKQKTFSEVIKGKKADKTAKPKEQPKAEAPAPAEKVETQEAAQTKVEAEAVVETPVETAVEAAAETPNAEEPAPKEPSEMDTLKTQVQSMGEQIQALTAALQHERTAKASSTDPLAPGPEEGIVSQNPFMDKVFQDGVKSRHNDYDQMVGAFMEHSKTNPMVMEQIASLPPNERFEQMYQAGVAIHFHKKYGTIHLPDLEKKFIAEGKRQAKEEQEKLSKTQRDRALAGISSQPTDTTAAKASGNESSVDEYRSPNSFKGVLNQVWGRA